jgi:hypothetical protein
LRVPASDIVIRDRLLSRALPDGHDGTEMARFNFHLAGDDVMRALVTADLDNLEDVMDRAEVLGRLLLLTQDDWYADETDPREIIVTDDKGFEVVALRLSKLAKDSQN